MMHLHCQGLSLNQEKALYKEYKIIFNVALKVYLK